MNYICSPFLFCVYFSKVNLIVRDVAHQHRWVGIELILDLKILIHPSERLCGGICTKYKVINHKWFMHCLGDCVRYCCCQSLGIDTFLGAEWLVNSILPQVTN